MAGSPPHRGATSHAPASSTRATSDSGPRCLKLLKNKPEINSDLLNSFAAAPPIRAFRTLRPRRPPPPRPSPAPVARDSGKSGVKADRNPRQLQIEDIGIQDKLCWQSFDILHAFGRTPVVPSGAVSVRSGTGIGFRPRKVDGGGHVADCSCRILFARRCSTGSRTLCIVPDPAALPFFRKEHRAGRFVLRVPLSLPARPGAPLPHRHGVPALPGNSTIRWQWIGASGQSPWEPRDSSGDTVSYFLSPDPRQWIRSLPTSRRILRRSLYPGVDWAVYASGDALEYDLILQPSADPASIRLRISAPKVSLTSGGSLVASTASGNIIQNPPVSYQVVRGKKKIVESRFVARDGGDFGLILGPRDPALPVFVDPSLHSVLAVEGSLDPRGGAVAAHPPHPRRQRRVNITHLNRTPSPPSGCGPGLSARTRPVPASTRT